MYKESNCKVGPELKGCIGFKGLPSKRVLLCQLEQAVRTAALDPSSTQLPAPLNHGSDGWHLESQAVGRCMDDRVWRGVRRPLSTQVLGVCVKP
jgi:hypothetical protein